MNSNPWNKHWIVWKETKTPTNDLKTVKSKPPPPSQKRKPCQNIVTFAKKKTVWPLRRGRFFGINRYSFNLKRELKQYDTSAFSYPQPSKKKSTIMTSYFINKQVLSSEISELTVSDSDNFLSLFNTHKIFKVY